MKVTYGKIMDLLMKKYAVIHDKEKNYFVNDNDEIIITGVKNLYLKD